MFKARFTNLAHVVKPEFIAILVNTCTDIAFKTEHLHRFQNDDNWLEVGEEAEEGSHEVDEAATRPLLEFTSDFIALIVLFVIE